MLDLFRRVHGESAIALSRLQSRMQMRLPESERSTLLLLLFLSVASCQPASVCVLLRRSPSAVPRQLYSALHTTRASKSNCERLYGYQTGLIEKLVGSARLNALAASRARQSQAPEVEPLSPGCRLNWLNG